MRKNYRNKKQKSKKICVEKTPSELFEIKLKILDFNKIEHGLYEVLSTEGLNNAKKEYERIQTNLKHPLKIPLKFYIEDVQISKQQNESDIIIKDERKTYREKSKYEFSNNAGAVVITKKILNQFPILNRTQVEILGLKYPLKKDWKRSVLGLNITPIQYQNFLDAVKLNNSSKTLSEFHLTKDKVEKNKIAKKILSDYALKIYYFLLEKNIKFEIEKKFDNCKNPKTNQNLFFDFYLPDLNICIEYDGEQHFMYVPKYHGENKKEGLLKLQAQQERDKIKNVYCEENSLRLIRINFENKKQIKEILSKELL